MPSARNKTIDIQRACVTADSVAIYDSLSRSEPGVTHHTYLNLTNGHCDCDCKRQSCDKWPTARDAGYTVLTIWMPRYHCIHIQLAIADSISRGERGDTGEINVLEAPLQPYNTEQENEMPHARPVAMAKIRTDSTAQFRAELNDNHVQNLMDSMENGAKLPSVTIYRDDAGTHWLADGFHTYEAHRRLERESILSELIPGTRRDAVLHGAGANADHGLPRTNADKRRAVTRLLTDPEWKQWSDRSIAEVCKVTHPFVGEIRRSLETVTSQDGATGTPPLETVTSQNERIGQDGRTINTANIGKSTPGEPSDDEQTRVDAEDRKGMAAQSGTAAAPANTAPKSADSDLTNDEWLDTLPVWEQLRGYEHQGYLFRTAAIAYRHMEPVIRQLRKLHKDEFGGKAVDGAFAQHIGSIALTPHPAKWVLCGKCKGSLSFEQSQCSCKGGYRLW